MLWYVAQLATELDLDLDEIAQANLDKLLSRQRRGVLSGSGDERWSATRRGEPTAKRAKRSARRARDQRVAPARPRLCPRG